ncbi:MAG: hydrolase TatD [Bacillaceae bacterium G1]|nr:hydrolase TatD [Bacillota bacterium]OJF16578.1 MAG: hydrolase TatD [Bacillaceae bacterium G1]
MELIDTHAHLDDRKFAADLPQVIQRALDAGVKTIVNIGYNRDSIRSTLALTKQWPFIYAAVGCHPTDADEYDEEMERWLEQLVRQEDKVVAIGEVGLDYHWDTVPRDVQEAVFRRQIALAKRLGMPLIIHNREADDDTVRILEEEGAAEVGGIMHCFAGDWAMAERCLAMNFYIGLGGLVTFKNAPQTKEVARRVPLDRLVLETDAPYMTPVPYRGKRNESSFVRYVAEAIAQLRGMTVQELAQVTTANARRLLGIGGVCAPQPADA